MLRAARCRHEVQGLAPTYGCPTVVHVELHVDVLGVGPQGVEGNHELASDVRTAEFGTKKSKDIQLTLAERLNQARLLRNRAGEAAADRQSSST